MNDPIGAASPLARTALHDPGTTWRRLMRIVEVPAERGFYAFDEAAFYEALASHEAAVLFELIRHPRVITPPPGRTSSDSRAYVRDLPARWRCWSENPDEYPDYLRSLGVRAEILLVAQFVEDLRRHEATLRADAFGALHCERLERQRGYSCRLVAFAYEVIGDVERGITWSLCRACREVSDTDRVTDSSFAGEAG